LRRQVLADAAVLGRGIAGALDAEGVVRHRGVRYAFDTAIVTAALDRLTSLNPCMDARTDAQRRGAPQFLRRCIEEGRGQVGAPEGPARSKWSLSFAPHLLKLAVALDDPSMLQPLVSRFVAGYWRDGWFRAAPRGEAPYAHAHAYALEGLVVLRAAGVHVPEYVLEEGTASLLRESARPRATTDVLAQTLRLALLQGHEGAEIDLLLDRLRGRAAKGGGFRYTAAVDADLNSWATVFALQALRWIRLGPEARSIA
jgi:hypothetical protein